MAIDLEDAKLLLQRAKRHIEEFKTKFGIGSDAPAWSMTSRREVSGAFVYSLHVNRATLREMKPIMADAANNLVHSLDHVAAACARLAGTGRSMKLFYPIADDDIEFAKLDKKVRPRVGALFMDLFADLRTKHRGQYHPSAYSYLALMREMAGSNKHWNLAVAHSQANAIAWILPGSKTQTIVEIPSNYFDSSDEFEFWNAQEPLPQGMAFSTIIGWKLKGFASFPNASPDSAYEEAARQVEEVIAEAEKLAPA